VTLTATVTSSGGTPTGTVNFSDGGALNVTEPLSGGVATFSTAALSVGSHSITATYGGDSNFQGSTSPMLTQVVNSSSTTTALKSSLNPSTVGQTVTLTATVTSSGGTPTGTVNFSDGGALNVTEPLSGGVATFSTASLSVGSHSITATYGGDSNFQGSTSSVLTQVVNQLFTLLVSVTGNGTVTSSPAGINCGSMCNANFAPGTQVTLTATPAPGMSFIGWSGACSGKSGCSVTMSAAQSVSAAFTTSGDPPNSRTWVSAVSGSDSNPCTRTAPCLTFAAALAQTTAGGEIDCLDPGGFGVVTINKALTINCEATLGSVLASGTNGIVVQAGPADVVTLNGVEFEGVGAGLNAVRFLSGKELHMHKFQIRNFANSGIDIEPSNSARVFLADGYISDCGVGGSGFAAILIKANSGANTSVSINHVQMEDNLNGVFADGSGGGGVAHVQVRDSVVSASSNNGISISSAGAPATADVVNNTIRYNINAGIVVTGAAAAMKLGGNIITNNVIGVASSGGVLQSFENNQITDNGADGIPINAVPGYSGTLQ
jgi:Bacterial Ig-like domain (group 3)/Divergent InlB B-repeat domain